MIRDKLLQEATRPGWRKEEFKIIAASSIASVLEWFDFFLYGSLTVIISRNFFSNVNDTSAWCRAKAAGDSENDVA